LQVTLLTIIEKNNKIYEHKLFNNMVKKMRNSQKIKVVFWHNDFNDGTRSHHFFGKDGSVFEKVLKMLPTETTLSWKFHGGFITNERTTLLKRIAEADVFIAAYPWNMDMNNQEMHYSEAAQSLLSVLQPLKKKNKKLKIFFLTQPTLFVEEYNELGEVLTDIHDSKFYEYFKK